MSEVQQLAARIANSRRHGHVEDEIAARIELKDLKAAEYIKNLIDTFPPLSEEQRARLAVLLNP
ncbi:hypothetical protein [Streptomyces sp. AcH 505]|uniref:hypothetical protein n=1 Tax=Streptomyces sp. AcH 505 TaxID=352211 RepID=UPI0012FEFBEE